RGRDEREDHHRAQLRGVHADRGSELLDTETDGREPIALPARGREWHAREAEFRAWAGGAYRSPGARRVAPTLPDQARLRGARREGRDRPSATEARCSHEGMARTSGARRG